MQPAPLITSKLVNKQPAGVGASPSEHGLGPHLPRDQEALPGAGDEAADGLGISEGHRAAAQRVCGAVGWSYPEAKRGCAAMGAAPSLCPSPYPLSLALALPPLVQGDARCPHAASGTPLGYGIAGISPETI